MTKFAQMIQPNIVVVTSIGSEHHTSFGSLENTRNEKAEMVRALSSSGLAVLNADDPNVIWMKTQTKARVLTFGFSNGSDVQCVSMTLESPYQMHLCVRMGGKRIEFNTKLVGKAMVYPILAAVAVAMTEGLAIHEMKQFLEAMLPTKGRLQPVPFKNRVTLLIDHYKSQLETFETALDTFKSIPAKRRVAVTGEIDELHGKVDPSYRWLGSQVAKTADKIIFIGSKRRSGPFSSGINKTVLPDDQHTTILHKVKNISDVEKILISLLKPGDLVLIKGSDHQKLERVILGLNGRSVRCQLRECSVGFIECRNCPALEHGWADGRETF